MYRQEDRPLYRGWCKASGWIVGRNYIHFNDRPRNGDVFNRKYRDFILTEYGFASLEPETVSIATGFRDNHWRMIYEGDILTPVKSCRGVMADRYTVVCNERGFELMPDNESEAIVASLRMMLSVWM